MTNYENGKDKIMKDFEELIEEASVYSYDKADLKMKMRKLLNHLDACMAYAHPGMK